MIESWFMKCFQKIFQENLLNFFQNLWFKKEIIILGQKAEMI